MLWRPQIKFSPVDINMDDGVKTFLYNEYAKLSGHKFDINVIVKHLPKRHEIWLLNKSADSYYPQDGGFIIVSNKDIYRLVTYMPRNQNQVTLVAVIAPPTSADWFRYYSYVNSNINLARADVPITPLYGLPYEIRYYDVLKVYNPKYTL